MPHRRPAVSCLGRRYGPSSQPAATRDARRARERARRCQLGLAEMQTPGTVHLERGRGGWGGQGGRRHNQSEEPRASTKVLTDVVVAEAVPAWRPGAQKPEQADGGFINYLSFISRLIGSHCSLGSRRLGQARLYAVVGAEAPRLLPRIVPPDRHRGGC